MADEADETIAHLTVNGHRPRVAVVGGSPASAMIATILVQQFGCETLPATGGEAVLALLRRQPDPAIDLVLLDLAVSDMDGIVAAQLIRTLGARKTLPIIALTDDRSRLATQHARAAGFNGAVIKPYSPRELHAAMETALARAAAAPAFAGYA
jgi:two-component system, chemotaxis family, chemotaxis protein CheY